MSSAAKGASRVGSAMTQLFRFGYRCSRVSSSGQRKGSRRDENCIPADLHAWAPEDSGLPHLIAEIGGAGKRLGVTFAEMHEHPLPAGFAAIVGVVIRRRWWWYTDPDSRHHSLAEALEALRSA